MELGLCVRLAWSLRIAAMFSYSYCSFDVLDFVSRFSYCRNVVDASVPMRGSRTGGVRCRQKRYSVSVSQNAYGVCWG
jgi:hypothetical protein